MREKVAERVAGYFARSPVRVATGLRGVQGMSVHMESSTILFGESVDLDGLIYGAMLLRCRDCLEPARCDDPAYWRQTLPELRRESERRLMRTLPGTGKRIVRSAIPDRVTVEWRRTEPATLEAEGDEPVYGQLRGVRLPGLPGSSDPFIRQIERRLEAGVMDLEPLPEWPGVHVCTVPAELKEPVSDGRHLETMQTWCMQERAVIQRYVRCFIDQSTHKQVRPQRRPGRSGCQLFGGRLHEIGLERRGAGHARPFRRRRHAADGVFHPDRFLGVFGWDDYSIARPEPDPAAENVYRRLFVIQLKSLEILGIPFAGYAFRDQLLTLRGGRVIYLHVPLCFKRVDEPMTDRVWRKVESLVFDDPPSIDRVASCQALQMRTMASEFRTLLRPPHETLEHFYISSMNTRWPGIVVPGDFPSLMAEGIDRAVNHLVGETGREVHAVYALPPKVVKEAAPGGWTAQSLLFG